MKEAFLGITAEANIIENAPMAEYTSFRAGGKADLLIVPQNKEELIAALKRAAALNDNSQGQNAESPAPYIVLGNGTNVLVKDGGYRGIIIKVTEALTEIKTGVSVVDGNDVPDGYSAMYVEAGVSLSKAATAAAAAGLSGLEPMSGIPGSIGGACFMNAGAYDGEMKQVISGVDILARDGSGEYTLSVQDMDYGYRHSVLYESGDIALGATLCLKKDDERDIRARMADFNKRRNDKQPIQYPSAGSFFKRPKGYFAGKLIQDAGLKGLSVGGAAVSEMHSGFIINTGGATATDIVTLMHRVQTAVYEKFGVMLEPEVRIIGEDPEDTEVGR